MIIGERGSAILFVEKDSFIERKNRNIITQRSPALLGHSYQTNSDHWTCLGKFLNSHADEPNN